MEHACLLSSCAHGCWDRKPLGAGALPLRRHQRLRIGRFSLGPRCYPGAKARWCQLSEYTIAGALPSQLRTVLHVVRCSTWNRHWPFLKILAGKGLLSRSTAWACFAIIIMFATGTAQLQATRDGPIMGIKQAAHSSHRATAESRAGVPVTQASTRGTHCHRRCVTS